jgi:hypothetical protein
MGEGGRPEMLRESNGQHYNQPIERGGGVMADGGRPISFVTFAVIVIMIPTAATAVIEQNNIGNLVH